MGNEGVVLFFDRDPAAAHAALDATLGEVGYARATARTDLEAVTWSGRAGLCLKVELTKAFGLVLARRTARRLSRPVRVFSARLVSDDPIDCAVDDLVVPHEGAPRQGRWGTDLAAEHDGDWSDLCDGKAYFAVSSCLDAAIESVLGDDRTRAEIFLAPPASLGAPRLDDLARQVRLADDAHHTVLAGRTCVRIRTAGATVTSFVSSTELDALAAALGVLLPTK